MTAKFKELYQIISQKEEENVSIQDYIITRTSIGEGQYGKVFLGQMFYTRYLKQNHTKVIAVKSVSLNKISKKCLQMLLLEISLMKQLNHINLVKFYDYKQKDDHMYIFLEYCNESTLANAILKEKIFTETNSKKVIKQLINGMYQLHKQNIIHRDLKPENILIHNGIIKICDFGFSRKIEKDDQQRYTNLGTPNYMSLQLLLAQPYSSKCDVWSMGVIFYLLLYGKLPFQAKNKRHLIDLIEESKTGLIFPNKPHRSDQAKTLLKQMLQVEENNRIGWEQLYQDPYIGIGEQKQSLIDDNNQIQTIEFTKSLEDDELQNIKQTNIDNKDNQVQQIKNYLNYQRQISILYNQAACQCYNIYNQIKSKNPELTCQLFQCYFILQKTQILMLKEIIMNLKTQKPIENFSQNACDKFYQSFSFEIFLKEFLTDFDFLTEFYNSFLDEHYLQIQNNNLITKIQGQDDLKYFKMCTKPFIESTIKLLENIIHKNQNWSKEIMITIIFLNISLNPEKKFTFDQQINLGTFYEDLNERTIQELNVFI